MVVVSEFMLAFNLNKKIDCNKLCHSIMKLLSEFHKQNNVSTDLVLTIDIKTVTNDDSLIPKLPFKNS